MSFIKTVDVSSYQYNIDWKKVKAAGIDYAILRIATKTSVDSEFEYNYREARAANIKVGVYKFCYADTVEKAIMEARSLVLNVLGIKILDLPIFYDLEWEKQESMSKKELTDIAEAFLKTIEQNSNYIPAIYTGAHWYNGDKLDLNRLGKYDFWIAKYGKDTGIYDESIKPNIDMVGWQYTSKGKVDGIMGNVDMSIFYKDYGILARSSTGWCQENDGTWRFYLSPNKFVSNDWYKYKDKWYWFDQSGTMVTNTWYMYKDKWYYLGADGAMLTGLQNIDGKYYFLNPDGDMATEPVTLTPDDNGALHYPGIIL